MAVKFGYESNRKVTFWLLVVTAIFGAMFVGMQAYEWGGLISQGARLWENPWGAPLFGSYFFVITGFHQVPDS